MDCERVVFSGVITLLLGLVILAHWPVSSLYILGLFLGIDLVFAGVGWIGVGIGLKGLAYEAHQRPPVVQAGRSGTAGRAEGYGSREKRDTTGQPCRRVRSGPKSGTRGQPCRRVRSGPKGGT